ncbi:MAG: hypothetical protein JST63_16765 [Bacteroidetes bacterium]|nr:hypothetical protein [Bacteroidota bacterium]
MYKITFFVINCLIATTLYAQHQSNRYSERPDSIATHKVVLDNESKLLSWIQPQSRAYDTFLRQRWNFIKTSVPFSPGPPPRSQYPQYYFYCAYKVADGKILQEPDAWMNDVGEKIPNWFESARLYYTYTGDTVVMNIVEKLAEYAIDHGMTPATFAWPNFPYTTTNAGDVEFKGFDAAKRFVLHEVQVDHAGDIGLTFYRLYVYTGKEKYKKAAIGIANTLADKATTGNAERSVWPYRVVMNTGEVTAPYGANWIGAYSLLEHLVKAKTGNVAAYQSAMDKVREFMLRFPMQTGYWADGHTDTDVRSNTYKSNMGKSNTALYILDNPSFDPDWIKDIPRMILWTETNFVTRCNEGEPATQWGANLVGEQDDFLPKMDYQTARYAAECAKWYAISGDADYKEKAYRSLNWVTYASDSIGLAFESPVSKSVSSWWSDCYGEGPRMFYHALAAVPEWAPPHENHILYSQGILKNVGYEASKIRYTATDKKGTEYLRLSFKPKRILLNGKQLAPSGYSVKSLGSGDYAVTIRREKSGQIIVE